MVELVLIVCLSATPDRCETLYLGRESPVGMMQCLFGGAKQAAQWAEAHPGWVVKRWNCGYPRA